MRDHRKLRAFELADQLTLLIYKITSNFPKTEMFGITSQMRRAVVSIPSNIVEGCARESQSEYLRFLEIAFASLRELSYQFGLANRLGYVKEINQDECFSKIEEMEKVLASLIRSLRKPKKPNSLTV
jgi:four helix bundle protein